MEALVYLILSFNAILLIETGINLKEKYEKIIEKSSAIVDYLVLVCIVLAIGIVNVGLVLVGIQNPLLNVLRIVFLIYGFYIVFPCNNILAFLLVQRKVKEKK